MIQEELRYTAEHFSILDNMPFGIFVLKKDYTVLFWNKCLADWTLVLPKDISGNDIRNYFPHFKKEMYKSRLETIFSGGPPDIFSSQRHKNLIPSHLDNGKLRRQLTNVKAIPSHDEKNFYAFFVIDDVTSLSNQIDDFREMRDKALDEVKQRKKIEAELKEQNQILQGILSATPIATALIENRKIMWGNDALRQLFQYDDSYIGGSSDQFYANEESYAHIGKLIKNKSQDSPLIESESEFKKKDGTIFTGQIVISCINPSNPFEKMIVSITDLTNRIQAEQDKIHKEKLQSVLEMAGTVCHELNQPLMAISGYSELILMGMDKNDPVFDKVNKIYLQISKTGEITKKLMGITKYETKKYTKTEQIIDLGQTPSPDV